MRNPTLRLVGFSASPEGGGLFGTRAEEELRNWLEARLDALGIDPVAYSRFVLSLLRRPISAFSPLVETVGIGRDRGYHFHPQPETRLPLQGDREQRRAVVQCLTSAADHKCGIESLVDELCAKLRELEGGGSSDEKTECKEINEEPETALDTLTPRDRALRYYAAFPALEPITPKKNCHKKDSNSGNKNAKINNNKNNNNNKICNKKTKLSNQTMDTLQLEIKESFGFAKSMERERELEKELEPDPHQLAELKAKFNWTVRALWGSDSQGAYNESSIWAAPSLSIPTQPLWPKEIAITKPFTLSTFDNNKHTADTPYQESIIDNSSHIQWDSDEIGFEDYPEESAAKPKYYRNFCNSVKDELWIWRNFSTTMDILSDASQTGDFILANPYKSPTETGKESRLNLKVNSLSEPEEDLLTSPRTHFRPIKEDKWDDGTTFPINNNIERIAYRKSMCGKLLYRPEEESPYMEYRESDSPILENSLTPKFRVRQNDKCIQTESIRSPVKRRILSKQDSFFNVVEADGSNVKDYHESEKNWPSEDQLGSPKPGPLSHNDRKRRHSSSIKCQSLIALRPLTL